MRITGVETVAATGRRAYVFVFVDTDEGLSGVGECGLPEQRGALAATVETISELLIGQDPMRTAHLWQLLARGLYFPARRELSAVISAVDVALWDLKGQALGVPVYELLGGRCRDTVPCYVHLRTGGGEDTARLVELAHAAVADGWKNLRFGLPVQKTVIDAHRSVRVGVAQFAALREAVGDDVGIALDVHTRLSPGEATTLCRELASLRPTFVEDPIRSENPRAMRALRERTTTPLAAGEQAGNKWELAELIENGWIDFARPDIALAGGFTELLKIAASAETHYIDVVPHNPLGPVANAAALHFSAACPNLALLEQPVPPGDDLAAAVGGQVRAVGGALPIPDGPGLGLSVDREALRATGIRDSLPPRLTRPDGSVANW